MANVGIIRDLFYEGKGGISVLRKFLGRARKEPDDAFLGNSLLKAPARGCHRHWILSNYDGRISLVHRLVRIIHASRAAPY